MAKKVTRRDFARTSVAVGAAAVGLGVGQTGPAGAEPVPSRAALEGAAVARRLNVALPPATAYGGDPASANFRDSILDHFQDAAAPSAQAAAAAGEWREGMTIPAEYYVDEKHYLSDERFLAEHLWLMVDHESRIPKPGDYFVFEFGIGDSVIILRDQAGAVKAYHNVCRHRGSRLCRHEGDPAPKDVRLSVRQLGSSGSTPVFRCPYHAWTYDLDGRLISAPNGMPADFDFGQNGLQPAHLQVVEGLIFVSLAQGQPPEFEPMVQNLRAVAKEYGTARLKIAARIKYPTRANWKLALENFQECYHCGPAHKSLVKTHPFWDGTMAAEQRDRLARNLDRYIATAPVKRPSGGVLNVGFATGSLDGKPLAPLLPNFTEYSHRSRITNTGWMTSNLQCYDDHIAAVRFTPRGVMSTDAEIVWLVRADAREGKDYRVDKLVALWDITMLEDQWIVENNHVGILSGRYTPGRYASSEGGPARLVKWYMDEVVPFATRDVAARRV